MYYVCSIDFLIIETLFLADLNPVNDSASEALKSWLVITYRVRIAI